jgi:predicted PurR-regulated permease PerM
MNNKLANKNYFLFAAFFAVLSFFLLQSFLYGILWGVLIAVSVWPTYQKFLEYAESHKKQVIKSSANYHAIAFTILFCIVFIVPIGYGFSQLVVVYELINQYIINNTNLNNISPPVWFEHLPLKEKLHSLWQEYVANSKSLLDFLDHFNTENFFIIFSTVWFQVLDRLITAIVMIVTLYFSLKHGVTVKKHYKEFFTYWFSEKSTLSIKNGIKTVRSTINGVVLVGIVEGVILSIPLLMGGISAGLIIGLIAGIAGVIPLLLPLLILPFLAYLFFIGEILWSLIGLADLLIVWFLFENIIKPQVIGKHVQINTFIVLISMIGGMQVLGPVGLFLGPAILAMTISIAKDFINTSIKNIPIKNTPILIKKTYVENEIINKEIDD